MNECRHVYLAEPDASSGYKAWKSMIALYMTTIEIKAWVFHGKHIKIWSDNKIESLPNSKLMELDDQTEHFDYFLLERAKEIYDRASDRRYSPKASCEILVHYLFNMMGGNYADEEQWHAELVKKHHAISNVQSEIMTLADHGWEVDQAYEAGVRELPLEKVESAYALLNHFSPKWLKRFVKHLQE